MLVSVLLVSHCRWWRVAVLFRLFRIFFWRVRLWILCGLWSVLLFPSCWAVGITLRVVVLRRSLLLLVVLSCSPTWVGFWSAWVSGCLACFWWCVVQFLFWEFLSIFHAPDVFCFVLVHVLAYLVYVENGIARYVLVCFVMFGVGMNLYMGVYAV